MTNLQQPLIRIGLFSPHHGSLFSHAIINEPFLLANKLLAQQKYHLLSLESVELQPDSTTTTNDSAIFDDIHLLQQQHYDLVIVVADAPPQEAISLQIKNALRQYYQQPNSQLLSINAGAWWLLESGIGVDQKISLHWSLMDEFKDHYPDIELSHSLYQKGQRISSCAGQLAIFDYLLDYLARHEQDSLINKISDYLCLDRLRSGDERQRLPSQAFAGEDIQPRLTMAIDLMENNIEEPLTSEQIAQHVCISRRQLERLFKRHLNIMPARHYLLIRLKRAQHLLQSSNMSIVQIGLSCGFSSGPHFSSSYKSFFEITPRQERSKHFAMK